MKKIILFALVTALVFIGCQRQAAAPSGGDLYRDTLIWAQAADVTNIDPHIGREATAIQVFLHIYDSLTKRTPSGDILPAIATHWEELSPTSWRFYIREGVRFHDGTLLTAEDVKFSLDRAVNTPSVSVFVNWISSVTVESPYVVRIDKHYPYAPMLAQLSFPFIAIVPKHHVEPNNEILLTEPMGTGPYRFVHWRHGVEVELAAFEDHWRGPPATRRLIMRVIPEAMQRVIALVTGEIDIVYEVPPVEISSLQADPNIQIFSVAGFSIFHVTNNFNKPPLNNRLVLQAISHAIDRQLIVDTIMAGAGRPADSTITPAVFGYHSTGVHRYDPAYSRQLLAQAGFPNGFETSIMVSPQQDRVDVTQAISEMLRDVGITARVEILEFGAFIQRGAAGEHDMRLAVWTTISGDAEYTFYAHNHSTQHGHAGNNAFISNPELDALIMRGRQTAVIEERLEAYRLTTIMLQDLLPQIPLFWPVINVGANSKVEGFVPDPGWYHWLYETRIRN